MIDNVKHLTIPAHKTEGVNRTKTVRFYPFGFTVEVPCKEVRTPLNSLTFSEERNEETCYGYCNEYQPHAVKRMFDHENGLLYDMRWDEAGNLGQVSMGRPGEMFEKGRFLFWTEDCCGPRPCGANRMHAAVDDRYFSYYAYDHSGGSCASREQSQACLSYAEMEQRRRSQRRLKLVGDNCSMDVNAEYMNASSALNEPTLYPSAYMVLTNKGYTKHYYAGTLFSFFHPTQKTSRARPSGLGSQLRGFTDLLPTNWFPMVLVCLPVIAIYQTPIFVRMTSDD